MDITKTLENLFGKTANNGEVKEFLIGIGEMRPVVFDEEDGEINTAFYSTHKDKGFSILFTDHAHIRHPDFEDKNYGVPVLSSAFFYSTENTGFNEFKGELPYNISFDSSSDDLNHVIGPSDGSRNWPNGLPAMEIWHLGNKTLHITYNKDKPGIKTIGYGLKQNF